MGSGRSSGWQVQSLSREQWQEVTMSGTSNELLSYGLSKVYRNVVTNEQIQQYRILFETTQHWEHYLSSFSRRIQEEYIVNSRFIDIEHTSHICGCGRYAKVYTERIPLRLHDLANIDFDDCVCLLYSALSGFQKLFQLYGYFKPISTMVGFDCEGRVKVWISQDFSQNIKHCPLQLQKIFLDQGKTFESQDLLVWEIISLFKEVQFSQEYKPSLIECFQGPLSFGRAKQIVLDFAAHHQIQFKRYFESLLPLIRQKSSTSKDYLPEFSSYDVEQISFKPIQKKDKVIYFIHPMEKSSEYLSSRSDVNQSIKSNSRCSLDQIIGKRVSILSTGMTVASPKHAAQVQPLVQTISYLDQRPQFTFSQVQGPDVLAKKRPRIQFNYTPTFNLMSPLKSFYCMPKEQPKGRNFIRELDERQEAGDVNQNRVVYNGTEEEYELDKDISQDMLCLIRKR